MDSQSKDATAEQPPAIMEEAEACLEKQQQAEEGEEAEDPKKKSNSGSRFKIPKRPNIKAPKVAGQRITLERNAQPDLDVISRDPSGLNQHCKVQFDDIIAEPDPTVFSFDSIWTISFKVFTFTKMWVYRILSLLCGIPAAFCWGLEFAMLSFCTIWCWQPQLRSMRIQLFYVQRVIESLLQVFVEPCCNTCGKLLSHVAVTVRREV